MMKIRTMVIAGSAVVAAAGIAATSLGVAAASTNSSAAVAGASAGKYLVIDANTDPADAVAALNLYQGATNRSFTPTGAPVFAQTSWAPVTGPDGKTRAGSVTGNAKTGQAAQEKITIAHEESSSWSLGGSIETSVGFDLAEAVDAELSVKFTANHTWESSYTDSESIQVKADPGKTVWIEVADNTITYTGNFTFDAAGVQYEVDNVTITQPGTADGSAMNSAIYRVREISSVQAGLPANTTGGQLPLSALPRMNQVLAGER
jgi:hypothetical protein